MTRPRNFSQPTISLADLVEAYHAENLSFAKFLDGKRPARSASKIPPAPRQSATRVKAASPRPGVTCDHCNQMIKRDGVSDLATARHYHSFCWTVVNARVARR